MSTILYSNGCSYTGNFKLESNERYPYLIANKLNWEVRQAAEPGSCNSRILRRTYYDCIELLSQNKNIVALVQLTHLHRTELPASPEDLIKSGLPDLFLSIKPHDPTLPDYMKPAMKLYTHQYNEAAFFVDLLSKLVGLTAFFKQNLIDYRIFFGPANPVLEPLDDLLYQYLKTDPKVLNLCKFNMLGLTGKQLHPDTEGSKIIADYFVNLLNNSTH